MSKTRLIRVTDQVTEVFDIEVPADADADEVEEILCDGDWVTLGRPEAYVLDRDWEFLEVESQEAP